MFSAISLDQVVHMKVLKFRGEGLVYFHTAANLTFLIGEPVRPINTEAWVQQLAAMRGMTNSQK
jgi:hypothetical protein